MYAYVYVYVYVYVRESMCEREEERLVVSFLLQSKPPSIMRDNSSKERKPQKASKGVRAMASSGLWLGSG